MKNKGIQTRAVHAGEAPDPATGATTPNVVMSTTYAVDPSVQFSIADQESEGASAYVYTRWGNPTIQQLAIKLAALEGAEHCLLFGSGMAAISALFIHLLQAGDHVLMSDVAYAGASELANEILPKMGIRISRVNMSDLTEVAAAIQTDTKLVYIETPCNPICRLTDIRRVAALAHQVGAKLAVDATFATPMATQPLALGADVVVHSLTKYLGGHGDAIGGALLGPKDLLLALHQSATVRLGGIISPFNAWLILRGIATFPLRMRMHAENALQVAQFLQNHPKIKRVIYPGLPSHPQHALAKTQMANFSGMLTFQVEDGPQAAKVFAERLQIFHYAVSLGHHKSLLFYMDTASLLKSSFWLTEKQEASYREFAGAGIFRVSIGIEDGADLCADLARGLAKCR
ncbi:MAG: PLP-dependent aspartate aminotransferase family protein [Saprospiraceae bacterium]